MFQADLPRPPILDSVWLSARIIAKARIRPQEWNVCTLADQGVLAMGFNARVDAAAVYADRTPPAKTGQYFSDAGLRRAATAKAWRSRRLKPDAPVHIPRQPGREGR